MRERLRRLRPRTRTDALALAAFLVLIVLGGVAAVWTTRHVYAVHELTRGVGDTIFYGADGEPWFRMDELRKDVPLDRISPLLRDAVIAIEDHRFYAHWGIDPIALARAVTRNVREHDVVQGGSTITQQLARTLYLSNRQTLGRKLQEAALALILEAQLSKEQILELYLNRVYLSSGVYGVEPLSERLFGTSAAELSLAQAALIAGLIRAPSALSPWSNLDGAVERSHLVLSRMEQEGFVTPAQAREARRARLRIRPYSSGIDPRAGYAKEYLRQEFRRRFGGDHPPEWQVHTTFRPAVQRAAERAVEVGLRRRSPELQAALVALDPQTGGVLALVGGRDFARTEFNRATRSRRQPGSAFKPLAFAAALSRGFSPVTVLANLDRVAPAGTDEWVPRNAGGSVPASLTLREALVESNNRAAVALQQRIGTRPILRLAEALNLDELPDVPSLSLGTGLVRPIDLTAAFAAFPNGGLAVSAAGIERVLDADGDEVFRRTPRPERVLAPEVAFQMVSILQDAVDRGTASPVRAAGLRFPAGGKTGTTDDFKDAWFVGFSSSVVAGVWVGFDRPATIGRNAYAARVALPIWIEFMKETARLLPPEPLQPPSSMLEERLCRVSYRRPVQSCPTYVEYFKPGDDVPGGSCDVHRGSLQQRVRRSVEGFLSGLGRKLKSIFK